MQDQKQTGKNTVSEGIAWLNSEGLGSAHPAAIQENAKTQNSFQYPCKCHVSSSSPCCPLLYHSTFKYHTTHEKTWEK